ncbi:M14 family zinc carboxypeptidase [Streptomyces sp. NPDC006422]|uniref:M14 family metallopeptidase n=1 Tax=unclassified Streptomyces TaxID=2593676 RepID=UPI0033B4E2EA
MRRSVGRRGERGAGRRARSILAVGALVLGVGGAALAPVAHADEGPAGDRPGADAVKVFRAEVSKEQIPLLLKAGQDAHELSTQAPDKGTAKVEVYLTDKQADGLRKKGVELTEHKLSSAAAARVKAAGDGVFRPYSGAGGLQEEILRTGQEHPDLTKVVSIGKTLQGQDILALKLSKNAKKVKDGAKPSVLYMSNQHAREWITPEMTRRLMHHYLDNYSKDTRVKKLVDSTEMWFVLSANPDGYDWTFKAAANRQWRKNLRDNNGDGKITTGDGVDLNRNFAYKWGYDDEGSSPDPANQTYRGPGPNSEPETKALDAFEKRVGFDYAINYHSAAELLLYGVGWQVATPTPDDVLYKALAGTPENSAIPGYHPQVSSELYTTNGEADGHAGNVNGISMFTPEMSTCQTASNVDPNDAWNPGDCASVFTFPDDEKLIQAEFAKNIPFAMSVAETAIHPDQPSSSVGLEAPDFTPAKFTTSYARGADQEVAVTARKSVKDKELNYRVNGGRTHDEELRAWKGGETYGGDDNLHFDAYRAKIEDADVGDKVEVWFTGRTKSGKRTSSEHFTYTVAARDKGDTLVVAENDSAGVQSSAYVNALKAAGRSPVVWNVAKQGAPDPLAVLGHFKAVVHYTGADRPALATQLALRDYLNEGGKLVEAGEKAGGTVDIGDTTTNDFSQYYLGAYSRTASPVASRFDGSGALDGIAAALGDAPGNPLNAAGLYEATSATLPQFTSAGAGQYEGAGMAAAVHTDDAYKRLTRTIDLTQVTAAQAPALRMQLLWDTEPGYDHVLLEAHTTGAEDWTTLPDRDGYTSTKVPTECEAGFFIQDHPALTRYLTPDGAACGNTGTSGQWNSLTGSSDDWKTVTYDLSAYAGRTVEVSLSYVTDPGTGGEGVRADNASVVVNGQATETADFETSLGVWKVPGPPAGSPPAVKDWALAKDLFTTYGAISTPDTVLLGFGLEHVTSTADRNALIRKALRSISE